MKIIEVMWKEKFVEIKVFDSIVYHSLFPFAIKKF